MRRRAALAAAVLAVSSVVAGGTTAHAQPSCIGLPCAVVNTVCLLVTHEGCVG